MNPRAALTTYSLSRGAPSASLGTSPKCPNLKSICLTRAPHFPQMFANAERRGWDSNPRALADKRFSRPPRYDHFDTSPANLSHRLCQRKMYITIIVLSCQYTFTSFFLFFLVFPKFPILYNDIRNFKVFWCRNFYIFIGT